MLGINSGCRKPLNLMFLTLTILQSEHSSSHGVQRRVEFKAQDFATGQLSHADSRSQPFLTAFKNGAQRR